MKYCNVVGCNKMATHQELFRPTGKPVYLCDEHKQEE